MKLKKWLILSHLAVMLTPIILALILFVIINGYNRNTQVMNYISTMSKFKTYEKVLDDPNIYDGSSLMNKKFNKPIKFLIESMNKFAVGYEDNLNYKCSDEIGELINHFNNMKNDIEEKRKTIELQQKSKEYMISAISHDLKTPLTAIRAYAESIKQTCEKNGAEALILTTIVLMMVKYHLIKLI